MMTWINYPHHAPVVSLYSSPSLHQSSSLSSDMERMGLKERVLRAFRTSLSKSPCGVTSRSLPDVVREPSFVSFVHRQASQREDVKREKPSHFWFGEMAEELQKDEIIAARRRKKEEERMMKRKRRKLFSNSYGFTSSSSSREDSEGDDGGVLVSSDEGGAETLLSSRSFSSDSSEFDYYSRPISRKRKKKMKKKSRKAFRPSLSSCSSLSRRGSVLEEVAEAVAEMGQTGFAVEKSSSDPREDFRCSMLEMIMEQQIFGATEMEGLLRSYLSLNPPYHHHTIVQVFSEIRDTLFGDTFLG